MKHKIKINNNEQHCLNIALRQNNNRIFLVTMKIKKRHSIASFAKGKYFFFYDYGHMHHMTRTTNSDGDFSCHIQITKEIL